MKTTVEIDDLLLRAAKRLAVDRGTSLRAVVEAGLRGELDAPRARKPIRFHTRPEGLPPDLDLSSREKMWEWLERNEKADCARSGWAPGPGPTECKRVARHSRAGSRASQ